MKRILILLGILFSAAPLFSRVSIALFPLRSESADSVNRWISYSTPELFFSKLYDHPDIQVWDPVFLASLYSPLGPQDSLLFEEARRWNWDIVIGGGYAVKNDSVHVSIRMLKLNGSTDTDTLFEMSDKIDSFLLSQAQSAADVLDVIPVSRSEHSITGIGTFPFSNNKSAYATYLAGYGFETRGMYPQALSAYLHAIELDNSLAAAHYRSAHLYWRARRLSDAQEAFEKAVQFGSQSPLYLSALTEFVTPRDPARATRIINKHASLLNRTAEGLRAMGNVYLQNGEYQRAISLLTRAVAAGPVDLETDFALGRAYMASGQYEMAAEVFSRLVQTRPSHIRYYSFLGTAYRSAGRLMESGNVLQAALRMEPENEFTLANLAHTYFLLGWYRQSEQLLERARENNPKLSELLVNLGVIYWHTDRKRQAAHLFEKAASFQTSAQVALANEANLLFLSGNVKKAIKKYRTADKVSGINESIMYNMGVAYLALKKYGDAYECFEEVLRLVPNRIDVLQMQASVAKRLGKAQRAEQIYKNLLLADPRDRKIRLSCIDLLREQKRYEEAVAMIEEYLIDFAHDRLFRLLLPVVYHERGWFEVAVETYKRLIAEPEYKRSYEAFLGLGKSMYECMRVKNNCNDVNGAIYYLKNASELNPARAEPEILIGHLYMDFRKHRDLAVEHWEKALEKATDKDTKRMIESLISEAVR